MKLRQYCVGDVATNCYLVFDENTKEAAIVDPGDKAELLLKDIQELELTLKYILLTHAHFDHIMAVGALKKATGALVVVNKADEYLFDGKASLSPFGAYGRQLLSRFDFPGADIFAEDGTKVTFGGMTAEFISTPGHTPGSCVIRLGDDILFTGDTLFCGNCGRTDLPGGDWNDMLKSLKKVAMLKGDYHVLPGHDTTSTLQRERDTNPYIKQALKA